MDNIFQTIRNYVNIEEVISRHVSLSKKGKEYLGLCPFHDEKTPSFTVNIDKRFYHCFGCGEHGDVINFISKINNMKYIEAAKKLSDIYNINIELRNSSKSLLVNKAYNILEKTNTLFINNLNIISSHNNALPIIFLKKRHLNDEIIKKFQIGYANEDYIKILRNEGISVSDLNKAGLIGNYSEKFYLIFKNRIMFPIINYSNKIVGFGGRSIDNTQAKYINSPESEIFHKKYTLYNENLAFDIARKKKYIYIVEGYIDAIRMYDYGFHNTVATLGTAVTETHLKNLWNYVDDIVMCFDSDIAGVRAIQKTINKALEYVNSIKNISFILLPKNYDPDTYLLKYGVEKFQILYDDRVRLANMILQIHLNTIMKHTPEEYALLTSNIDNMCNKIKDYQLLKSYRRFFNKKIWELQNGVISNRYINSINENIKEIVKSIVHSNNRIYIELAIIALFIHEYKSLHHDKQIIQYFIETEFINQEAQMYQEKFFNLSDNSISQKQYIGVTVQNTDQIFNSLSNSFKDKMNNIWKLALLPQLQSCSVKQLWQFLIKKHQIFIIQELYKRSLNKDITQSYQLVKKLQTKQNELNDLINEFS